MFYINLYLQAVNKSILTYQYPYHYIIYLTVKYHDMNLHYYSLNINYIHVHYDNDYLLVVLYLVQNIVIFSFIIYSYHGFFILNLFRWIFL